MAIDSLLSKNYLEDIKIKVVGGLPERIKRRITNIKKFEFYGYVSSQDLEELYANCGFFFYPTLNEGFGSPPLEAMKYGKTCVISSVCSLTEVYGESVYYCNPYDQQEMQNKLLQAYNKKIDKDVIYSRRKFLDDMQKSDMKKLLSLIANG